MQLAQTKSTQENSLASFIQTLPNLKAKARLDAILKRPDAARVVQQIASQDLLVTIKEVGLSDTLELVELLSKEQVQEIVDLDAWKLDRIDPKNLGEWLETLYVANPRKALQQFLGLDLELISLLYKTHAMILDTHAGEEPGDLEGLYSTSPDQRFFICFDPGKTEDKLVVFLHQALLDMYGRDMKFAMRLLEAVRWDLPSQLEEEALHHRDGRLQDMGFAPLEESRGILAYLNPERLKALFAAKAQELVLEHETERHHAVLALPKEWGEYATFNKALQGLSLEELVRTQQALVQVVNQVHMALHHGSFGEPEMLSESARYTLRHIEVALLFLSENDPARLTALLRHHPVKRLFQAGHSLAKYAI